MDTKERIILATLELAAQNGLGSVTLSQIAEKLGFSTPALYKHFGSKEAIIEAMYAYLRERSKQLQSLPGVDFGEMIRDKSASEVLGESVKGYSALITQSEMMTFYKVIYAQRSVDATAAKIMAEETSRMIVATKNLFYALQAHGKLNANDLDMAATSFAMTVHGMLEYDLDCKNSGEKTDGSKITDYIKWYCEQLGGQ